MSDDVKNMTEAEQELVGLRGKLTDLKHHLAECLAEIPKEQAKLIHDVAMGCCFDEDGNSRDEPLDYAEELGLRASVEMFKNVMHDALCIFVMHCTILTLETEVREREIRCKQKRNGRKGSGG